MPTQDTLDGYFGASKALRPIAPHIKLLQESISDVDECLCSAVASRAQQLVVSQIPLHKSIGSITCDVTAVSFAKTPGAT